MTTQAQTQTSKSVQTALPLAGPLLALVSMLIVAASSGVAIMMMR
jgi:hypothetical protein